MGRSSQRRGAQVDWRQVALLWAIFAVVLLLWNTPVAFPVKLFAVFVHELGHGVAAVLTGGEIVRIEIGFDLGGSCLSRGGWRPLVLPAGYLGSMAGGGAILLLASRTRADRALATALGVTVVACTLLFVRNLGGVVFGLGFGALLASCGRFLPERVNDLWLKTLGLATAMYAVTDIVDDLLVRTVPGSDAYAMSRIVPLPPPVWGAIWLVAALALGFELVVAAARRKGR